MIKNKYVAFFTSAFITFVIPFYPVYVLLTNTELGLAAIIYIQLMIISIPIGFFVGLLSYKVLSVSKTRLIYSVSQLLVFLLISIAPIIIFQLRMRQETLRYASDRANFTVTVDLLKDQIVTKKHSQGESYLTYEYELEFSNSSDSTFNDISTSVQLKTANGELFASGLGSSVILPRGSKIVVGNINLYSDLIKDISISDQMSLVVSVSNVVTNVHKNFTFQSTLTSWRNIVNDITRLNTQVTAPIGFNRFRNVMKGIQLDYPQGWGSGYGAESGAPPSDKVNATNHFFSKVGVGMIILQWDNYLPYHDFCYQGKTEEDVESFMSNSTAFLQTYKKLGAKGVKVRVCVENESNVEEIKTVLNSLKII